MAIKQALRALLLVLAIIVLPAGRCRGDEFRGFWVDGFASHEPSFKDATQTTNLVNNAAAGRFNAICMSARQVGYSYFIPTPPNTEPRGSVTPSSYDPLADMITKAHAQGIKVHAWVWCNRIAEVQYSNPSHVMNVHPEWLTRDSSGNNRPDGAYWLDPGVPDAMTWNYNVCMDIIQHYDIDGLHFDYIRYPGLDAGYNAIAIARYNDEFGRAGQPPTTDLDFSTWRRRQITDFVKRVYASAVAIKPNTVISCATFASGSGFANKLQDWPTWMSKGYVDANAPMIYYGPTGNSSFLTYMRYDHDRAYGRHTYIGQGAGSNPISNTITQIGYIRDEGCEGTMCYSYHNSNNEGASTETFFSTIGSSVFAAPANAPAMPWKTSPTQGILKGAVTGQGGAAVYNAAITLNGQTELSDGTGFYALMKLTPGTYAAICVASGYVTATAQVTISAGAVTTRDFALVPDGTPPVMGGIQATDIWSTLATINWTTDEKASGQVEYGLTTSYGYQTALNTAKLNGHSFALTGLSPARVYHYRATSVDGTGNIAVSDDQTFTTGGLCAVQDIIIDNNNANNTGGSTASSSGSWTIASNLGGKYLDNYAYIAHVSPPDTAWFRWTPNVIVPGAYNVYVWYTQDPAGTHSTGAPYTVSYDGGSQTFSVNQHIDCGKWNLLGSFTFLPGATGYVQVGNGTDASGSWVMADAVKLSYVCETVPPVISTVSVSPPMVVGGAPLEVTVSASDNVEVNTVTADGTLLEYAGGATYSGAITAKLPPGLHGVDVIARDTAGNTATDATQSYRTAPVYALTNASLLAGGPVQTAAWQYLYKTWGSVTVLDVNRFGISDGSPEAVVVHCPNHGLTTGRFITVYGTWNPPLLESRPGQIQVIF